MHNLEKVKSLLELGNTHQKDEIINVILEGVESKLKLLLEGASEIPADLNYIVVEVAVSRFNRIGSEGFSSHGVDGESISFTDDDFGPYRKDIAEYLKLQKTAEDLKRGKVIFI